MKNIFISPKENIRSAMKQLNNIAERCLLVAKDDKLLGTLTDGDIRRNILATKKINGLVENAYNKNPHVIIDEVYDKKIAADILKKEKIDLIPIIDSNKTIKNFITWDSLGGNINYDRKGPNLNKSSVVIMSGGKGTRLQPFTSVLPKPLIPIKGKTMLEHIIANFVKYGVKDFFVTVNYKSKILKAYFEELNPKYNITFIEEHKPLGTSGSLKYLSGKINDNFFVTNCDIIIRHDYPRIFNFHNKISILTVGFEIFWSSYVSLTKR